MEVLAEVLAVLLLAQYATATDGVAVTRSMKIVFRAVMAPMYACRFMMNGGPLYLAVRSFGRKTAVVRISYRHREGIAPCTQRLECGRLPRQNKGGAEAKSVDQPFQ